MNAFTWLLWTERNGMGFSTRFLLMDRVVITYEEDDGAADPYFRVHDFPDAAAAQDYAIRQTATFEVANWDFTGSVMTDFLDFVNLENFLKFRRDPGALRLVVSIINQILQHGRELG